MIDKGRITLVFIKGEWRIEDISCTFKEFDKLVDSINKISEHREAKE